MRGVDSIGKIKPYMFSLKKEGRLHYLVWVSSYLLGRGGLEMWSGHFNFFFRSFFSFFFGTKNRHYLTLRYLTSEFLIYGDYRVLAYLSLLLREYERREMFDSNKLSSRLRWEMVPFSCTRYIPMHES